MIHNEQNRVREAAKKYFLMARQLRGGLGVQALVVGQLKKYFFSGLPQGYTGCQVCFAIQLSNFPMQFNCPLSLEAIGTFFFKSVSEKFIYNEILYFMTGNYIYCLWYFPPKYHDIVMLLALRVNEPIYTQIRQFFSPSAQKSA